MSRRPAEVIKHLLGSNKVLFAGVFLLAAAITMILLSWNTLTIMQECKNPRGNIFPPGQGNFVPGSSFSMTCQYRHDIGQDLIFWARILEEADPVAIPSHLEIRDPANNIIVSQDFNSATVVMYIRPETFGVYNATITNLEPLGTTYPPGIEIFIRYGFGHLTSNFPGVNNPIGDMFQGMAYWGYALILPSLILIGFAIVRGMVRGAEKRFKQSQE